MDIQHLIHMANRIGEFFEPMADATEARQGIVRHLQLYWAPPMRRQLAEHVRQGGEGLAPLVLESLRQEMQAAV
jgi:formate dehydrogenase subunit delta